MDFLLNLLTYLAKPFVMLGLREDLAKHAIVGFAVHSIAWPLVGPWYALLAVLAVALGREAWNKWGPVDQRTGWSPDDIKATLAGALAALSGAVPMLLTILF